MVIRFELGVVRAERGGLAKDDALLSGTGNQIAGSTTYRNNGKESNLSWKQDDKINAALDMLSLSCPQDTKQMLQAEASSSQLGLKCKKGPAWRYRFGSH